MMELAAIVQKALRVGAAIEARDAGRKAFAELTKFLSYSTQREAPSTLVEVVDIEKTARVSGLRTAMRRLRKGTPPSQSA
ncbi:hypothetical protein [Acidisoma cladoniae]|uniref:hypothetical protein n=1 Tax=Acidisoma cladoniae TaxID=3040935 RepID=UPI00254C8E01|nr:hypothetical protein [Acidisoma sp. PAMC 29798]